MDNENLGLKLEKCAFFQSEVNWLGHKLTSEGITLQITKTEAILKLQHPKSLKQLRSFMGSINHLSKFIPNAASLTDKLRSLLRKKKREKEDEECQITCKKFEWGEEHSRIFEEIKTAVARIAQTHYYHPKKDARVKCDASHSGLGATLE